jgi:alpha-mannosidase
VETLGAAERYRHPFETVRGRGPADADAGIVEGLRVEGDRVVLSAVRRRADDLEVRVVNQGDEPRRAKLVVDAISAHDTDLLGRPGAGLAVGPDGVELDLGPWEIRTVSVRGATPCPGHPTCNTDATLTARRNGH